MIKMISDFFNYFNWENIIIIAFIGYNLFMIARDLILPLRLKRLYHQSIIFFDQRLGYIISIMGRVKSGKSTLGSGLCHIATQVIANKIDQTIMNFRRIAPEINYLLFDGLIYSEFDKGIQLPGYYNQATGEALYVKKIYPIKEKIYQEYHQSLSKPYNDFLNLKYNTVEDLLLDYIFAIIRKRDNNFILANTPIFNRLTLNWNKYFDPNYMALKNEYIENSFKLNRYTVVLDDEKSGGLKISTEHVQVSKSDDGTKEAYRFYGHMFHETSYCIVINQNTNRWVKEEREIATSYINLNDHYQLRGGYQYFTRWINRVRKVNNWIMILCSLFKRRRIKSDEGASPYQLYLASNNCFKCFDKRLYKATQYLFSKSFIVYPARIYDNDADLNSNNEELFEKFNFVLPLRFCFGTTDQHVYDLLYKVLESNAKTTYYDLPEMLDTEFSRASSENIEKNVMTVLTKRKVLAERNNSASAIIDPFDDDEDRNPF